VDSKQQLSLILALLFVKTVIYGKEAGKGFDIKRVLNPHDLAP